MDEPDVKIEVHTHGEADEQVLSALDRIEAVLLRIEQQLGGIGTRQETVMADLDALAAEVQENTDAVASASALLSSLSQQLRDAAADPAAIQALADQLDANNQALSEAVAANTPAAAPPAEPPPTPEVNPLGQA